MSRARDVANIVQGSVVLNEDSADVDIRVESNGNANMLFVDGGNDAVVIGQSAPETTITGGTPSLQVIGSAYDSIVGLTRRQASAYGPQLALCKSRNTSVASYTIVQAEDNCGSIVGYGDDGTNLDTPVASVSFNVDGTPGANDMPGRITFNTTADGAATLTERMRINSSGTVQVGKNTTSADDKTTFQMTGSNGSNAAQTFTIFNDGENGNTDIKRSTGGGSSLSSWRINPGGYTKINYNLANANDAGGSNHEIGHANNDTPILNCYGSHSSFVSDILQTKCERSANSGYYFITCKSNVTSSSDNEFLLRGDGNAYADGSWSGSGADYAEFFETKDGKAIAIGTTVVLDGNKVRASTSDDAQSAILGVVRPKAINGQMHKSSMTIGNTAWNHWSDKYLTDDFQQYVMEEYTVTSWEGKKKDSSGTWHDLGNHSYETDKIPADGTEIWGAKTPPSDAVVTSVEQGDELKGQKMLRKKLNPDYDESKAYVNRENRDEWQIIGLLGQVQVLKGQKMGDRWIKMRDISDTVEEYMIR